MEEINVGSMLASLAEMEQRSGASLGAPYLLTEDVKKQMEAEAKAHHKKHLKRRKARRKWAREFKVALRDPGLPTLKFPLRMCLDEVVIHGRDDAKTK